jgi:uroporphyrinogen III methyltransferase/synthase
VSARPLAGKRIVVTRAAASSKSLSQPLEQLGAQIVEIPTIEIRDPDTWQPLDSALRTLHEFDFLLLTSANAVEKLLGRFESAGRALPDLAHLKVGAIGPATTAVLTRAGIHVDFVAAAYRAEGLLEAVEKFQGGSLKGKSFLIPRAKVARDFVPRALRERGARVEVVDAYVTELPVLAPGVLEAALSPLPSLVTFTSSSTAANFARLIGDHGVMDPTEVKAASIGPVTSRTARRLGFDVVVEAAESTASSLVEAIRDYFTPPVAPEIKK